EVRHLDVHVDDGQPGVGDRDGFRRDGDVDRDGVEFAVDDVELAVDRDAAGDRDVHLDVEVVTVAIGLIGYLEVVERQRAELEPFHRPADALDGELAFLDLQPGVGVVAQGQGRLKDAKIDGKRAGEKQGVGRLGPVNAGVRHGDLQAVDVEVAGHLQRKFL